MKHSRLRTIALLAPLALAGCGRGPAVWSDTTLPLRRVVVYRNGVGYFERAGRVPGDRVEFRVRRAEVGDFLATLAVRERGGSSVVSAAFPMPDSASAATPASSGGSHDDARSAVRLQLDGRGHDLAVGYMTETPYWRPSYRLLFTEHGVDLQAWAIVQNVSGEDWTNVHLALVSGSPVAFRSELGERTRTVRPLVTDRGEVIETVPGATTSLAQSDGPDRDADGIADSYDRCPESPEDRDGNNDADGCPDTDRDGDRIADVNDRCPNEPETYNGIEDVDGCPDRGTVVLEAAQIRILNAVQFPRDSDRWTPGAVPVLDAVVATLNGNPQIRLIAVEGFAEPSEGHGSAAARQTLSQSRAGAVVSYMITHGVAGARLQGRGLGDAQPVAPNNTEANRARNRRVSFRIVDGGQDATTATPTPIPTPVPSAGATPGATGSDAVRPSMPRGTTQLAALASRGGTSRFELRVPVTVPNESAAMVLLTARSVPGQRMYLFAPDGGVAASSAHPFEVARFENGTGALLERGPLAIFDEGAFLGQGVLEPLPEGASATVPFALERAIDVESASARGVEGERLARVTHGELVIERFQVVRTTYQLRNGIGRAVRVMLRHEVPQGAALYQEPDGTELSPRTALVPADVPARGHSELVVQTRAPFEVRAAWTDEFAAQAIEAYLRDGHPADAVATPLRTALTLRRQLLDTARARATLNERRADLARAVEETRANLMTVERTPRAGDLRAQLTARLAQTSAQIAEADRAIVEADTRAGELRVRLNEAVRALELDTRAPAPPPAPGSPRATVRP